MFKRLIHRLSANKYQTLNLIEISKQALINNFRYFQKNNPHKNIAPVLKSNAYGHGLKTVAQFLDTQLNPAFITVDSLYEAYQLKKARIKTKPLLIGYTNPENFKTGPKIDYCLPIYDLESAEIIARFQPHAETHIKIDTGMNRLGIQPKEARSFSRKLKKIKNLKVTGIYSHFSQASELNKKFTQKQLITFKKVIKIFEQEGFRFQWKHIGATSGSIIGDDEELNLIRPGLGFYGLSPLPSDSQEDKTLAKNLTPALKLTSHIVGTKVVLQGTQIGYGGTFTAKTKMRLGILPLGYYEGVDRRLSNKGMVQVGNKFCSIIGRVCMNLTIIDLTSAPKAAVKDQVVVFSNQANQPNSILSTAQSAETTPYVILVNLAESIRRKLI